MLCSLCKEEVCLTEMCWPCSEVARQAELFRRNSQRSLCVKLGMAYPILKEFHAHEIKVNLSYLFPELEIIGPRFSIGKRPELVLHKETTWTRCFS